MFPMIFRRRKTTKTDYAQACRRAVRAGKPVPKPADLEELAIALTRFPRSAARFRPSAADLRGMGLPPGWPFSEGDK